MAIDVGRVGVWMRSYNRSQDELVQGAVELERLGYGAIWLGRADPGLQAPSAMLAATERIVVATGIVSIWDAPADELARNHRRVSAAHPGRFLLGLGVSHGPVVGARYQRPYSALVQYLDGLDAAGVPADERILAALGPKALQLAKDRSIGAHPYLVPPEYTAQARAAIGSAPLLATEQMLVLDEDLERARTTAREGVAPYLGYPNYVQNLRRLGFGDTDLDEVASDRLLDALVGLPDGESAAAAVRTQLDAGSDHVCVQVLSDRDDLPIKKWAELADVLL